MQEIIYLLALLSFVQAWTMELPQMIGRDPIPYKPFNCAKCLSWWLGVAAAIIAQNPIFLILYLMNAAYERYIY